MLIFLISTHADLSLHVLKPFSVKMFEILQDLKIVKKIQCQS